MTTIKKAVQIIEAGDIIKINGLSCEVLTVEASPSGKTAKVFYTFNGEASFIRCGINTFLEVEAPAPVEDKPLKIFPSKPRNNVVMFRSQERVEPEIDKTALSQEYRTMFQIISDEHKEIHDFYLKHIIEMPALVRKSVELAMKEIKAAKEHLQEKHEKEIGYSINKI